MATTKYLDIKEFDEFLKALEHSPQKALPLAKEAMTQSVALIQDILAEYPPLNEGNQPGRYSLKNHRPMGYYERGRGWWYPVMQEKTLGKKIGVREGAVKTTQTQREYSPKVRGYKLRRTSERLGSKWTMKVTSGTGYVQGEVGTTVSYADVVQGDKQAKMHKARGWKNADQALDEAEPEVMKFFGEATDKLLEKL